MAFLLSSEACFKWLLLKMSLRELSKKNYI